ncbi:hypothetical protein RFI_21832, partial [Reticulomyxa filosa]
MDEKIQAEQTGLACCIFAKGLKIEVYVDDGRRKTKFDCPCKTIYFPHLNVGSVKELTHKEVVNKIKMQFGDEFPGIMDDTCTVNVKWKLVSFKEAYVMLSDDSRDVLIPNDDALQEEFLDESENETSSDEDASPTTKTTITKLLIRKIGNFCFSQLLCCKDWQQMIHYICVYVYILEFMPVETKVIGIETDKLMFCWKMTNDSLKIIETNMKRYNEEYLQLNKMTSQNMWWFNVCVTTPLSSPPTTAIENKTEDVKQSDKEKETGNKKYWKVTNDKTYVIVKDLSKDTSYEISVQTCFEWRSINNLQQIDKKLESSWTP